MFQIKESSEIKHGKHYPSTSYGHSYHPPNIRGCNYDNGHPPLLPDVRKQKFRKKIFFLHQQKQKQKQERGAATKALAN